MRLWKPNCLASLGIIILAVFISTYNYNKLRWLSAEAYQSKNKKNQISNANKLKRTGADMKGMSMFVTY